MGVNRFRVVSIKDTNGIQHFNTLTTLWVSNAAPANAIIYPRKYSSTEINGEAGHLKPAYRAFLDGTTPKVTGSDITADAAYFGADPSQPVPSLDEEAWMSVAISGTVPATLAPNYAGLPAALKMTQAEWDTLE